MPEKDPLNWQISTWILAVGIGMAGGVVNYITKRSRTSMAFSIIEMLCEMFISGFVSLLAFLGLHTYGLDIGYCAAISGICGHMSTRLLFVVEKVAEKKIEEMHFDD